MDQELYKAAKEGNVSCLSVIDGRNTTEEEAMNNHHGKFLKRTQHGNNNILHIAARAGRDTFVAKTLEHFPFLSDQVNSKGDSPVLVAARFGHLKVVKTLAEPNNDQFRIQDENGTYSSSTPRQGDVEEGPVDHQLDVPIPQYPWRVKNLKQYTTALHEALRNGHQNVARYLLGLDPEMAILVNDAGESPLFLAAESCCQLFMTDILLSNRPYSTKGPHGLNPLHVARHCDGSALECIAGGAATLGPRNRLMWFHLRRRGASRGRHPNEQEVPVGGMRQVIRSPNEDMKPFINTLALVAALIATLTFAAAFTMPGGYQSSPDNLVGVATLANKAALKVFVLSDTLAMCFSILTLFLLLTAMTVEQDVSFSLTNTSGLLLGIALYATLVAFICGIFAVIAPKALWVAIVVCIICSVAPFFFWPERVEKFTFIGLFMPTIPIKDFQRLIQNRQQRKNKKREQHHVQSLIQRGSPDTTYCVSNTS